jgi:hypothetical protein
MEPRLALDVHLIRSRAHLGDVAAVGAVVGLAQPRGQPGPRAQPARVVEATDVADLGDEHGGR